MCIVVVCNGGNTVRKHSPLLSGVMVATLQLPGTSGPKPGWSLEASMTPTSVSFLCKRLLQWYTCVASSILTVCFCVQVVVPTPSPPASTMWMAADPLALERKETHPSASCSVKLDTHLATNKTSTMVRVSPPLIREELKLILLTESAES